MSLGTQGPGFILQKTDDENVRIIQNNDKHKLERGKVFKQYDGTIYIEVKQMDENLHKSLVKIHPKYEDGEPVTTFEGAAAYLAFDYARRAEKILNEDRTKKIREKLTKNKNVDDTQK